MKAALLAALLLGAACHTSPTDPAPPRPPEAFEFVPLQNAAAPEVQHLLLQLLEMRPDGSGPTIVADARTNSLIVRAQPAELPALLALVARLDRPVGDKAR